MAKPIARFVRLLMPKRRWAQFSLGTMFVVVTGLCIPLAWLGVKMHYKRLEREAVAALRERDVWVGYGWQWMKKPQPPGPVWIRKQFGEDFLAEVHFVGGVDAREFDMTDEQIVKRWFQMGDHQLTWATSPGRNITDETMAKLPFLTRLRQLYVVEAPITDAGLANLAGLDNLDHLDIAFTKVSDAGMVHLAKLSRLKFLDLNGTGLSDVGLKQLAHLANLESLDVGRTNVSDAGLIHLNGFTRLKSLNLDKTQVTDVGVSLLAPLVELETLNLDRTRLTDASLVRFKEFPKLKSLNLDRTLVTYKAVTKLRKALPNCRIDR